MSNKDEWETPDDLYEELDREFGFWLDPCATKENHKAWHYFTIEQDGLTQSWKKSDCKYVSNAVDNKDAVFMNCPYSRGQLKLWLTKAVEESKKGCTVVCLIPADTSTKYWHEIVFPNADEIRFLEKRIKFKGAKSCARFASAIVIFRPPIDVKYKYSRWRK